MKFLMPSIRILVLCYIYFCASAFAQDPDDDPMAGTVVDCGSEKAAILGGTESPDGRYALGWTIRPKRGKERIDWSDYDPKHPSDWGDYATYDYGASLPEQYDYALVNGLLNLREKTFVAFDTEFGYAPWVKGSLHPAWMPWKRGVRYALVYRANRLGEIGSIWLVEMRPGNVHVHDVLPAADKAVDAFLRKHILKDQDNLWTEFEWLGDDDKSKPLPDPNKTGTIKLPFDVLLLPDKIEGFADGNVVLAVPGGAIRSVTGK